MKTCKKCPTLLEDGYEYQYCVSCLNKRAAHNKGYRTRQADKGLCTKCGRVAAAGKTICEHHLLAFRVRGDALKSNGLCKTCRAPIDDYTRSTRRCTKCLEVNKQERRTTYTKRKENGDCLRCGLPLNNEANATCSNCSEEVFAFKWK